MEAQRAEEAAKPKPRAGWGKPADAAAEPGSQPARAARAEAAAAGPRRPPRLGADGLAGPLAASVRPVSYERG